MRLSKHFTLEEFTLSQTAERLGLDNSPTPEALDNLKRLAAVLEQVRSFANRPINISSGYRSPAVNKAVGGAATSAHLRGLAADFNASGMGPKELARLIQGSGIQFDQLILEYDRWVHLAISKDKPRNQVLTIRKGTGYMPGLV